MRWRKAYRRDMPGAQVNVLDAGHFAMDTAAADEIAALIRGFVVAAGPARVSRARLKGDQLCRIFKSICPHNAPSKPAVDLAEN
jgi:hypothetical protein